MVIERFLEVWGPGGFPPQKQAKWLDLPQGLNYLIKQFNPVDFSDSNGFAFAVTHEKGSQIGVRILKV